MVFPKNVLKQLCKRMFFLNGSDLDSGSSMVYNYVRKDWTSFNLVIGDRTATNYGCSSEAPLRIRGVKPVNSLLKNHVCRVVSTHPNQKKKGEIPRQMFKIHQHSCW